MKKAKIMLMAIAVVGIAGAAVAFKTHSKFSNFTFYSSTVVGTKTVCAATVITPLTTNSAGTDEGSFNYSTVYNSTTGVVDCPAIELYSAQ